MARHLPASVYVSKWQEIRNRECNAAGIGTAEFSDFLSIDPTVRAVQNRVIWLLHELGIRPAQIGTHLECSDKRVAEALKSETPAPKPTGPRQATAVNPAGHNEARDLKIDTALTAAAKRFDLNREQFRSRKGLPHESVIGAILLVLEYQNVSSFYVLEHLGGTDEGAQETLHHARLELSNPSSGLYHYTSELCEELRIPFKNLQKVCT
ncbi:MAG: hypothetical protein JWM46_904 [Candidatus Kaiserbacteria bacterium]|nr:hypothetical protein [Candidatus Kaiserbacteria bacterium]